VPSTYPRSITTRHLNSQSVEGKVQRPFRSSTGIAIFRPTTGIAECSPRPQRRASGRRLASLAADRDPPFPFGLAARCAGRHVGGQTRVTLRGSEPLFLELMVSSSESGPRCRSTYRNRATPQHDKVVDNLWAYSLIRIQTNPRPIVVASNQAQRVSSTRCLTRGHVRRECVSESHALIG